MFKESIRKPLKKIAFEDPKGTLIKAFVTFLLIASLIYYGVILFVRDISADIYDDLIYLIVLFITSPLLINLMRMFLDNSRDELISFSDLFKFKKYAFKFTWFYFLVNAGYLIISFILGLIPILGFILNLILGIILFPVFAFMPFIFLGDSSLSFKDFTVSSFKIIKGNLVEFYGLILSFVLWFILGLFTFGLLYIWLIPYLVIGISYFYLFLKGEKKFEYERSLNNLVIIVLVILGVIVLEITSFITDKDSFNEFKEEIGLTTLSHTESLTYGSYKVWYNVPEGYELSSKTSFTKTYVNDENILQYTLYLSSVDKVLELDKDIVKDYEGVDEEDFSLKVKDKTIKGYKYSYTKDDDTLSNIILYYPKDNYTISISLTTYEDVDKNELKKFALIN